MASGKTLSNTTMNLRFMKNAVRSQQIKEATLPQAKVKDDGEWEVSQAVREAWGLTTTSSSGAKELDVHEDSYLPFIFEAGDDTPAPSSSKGRRAFGKNGEEVIPKPSDIEAHNDDNTSLEPTDTKGRKVHPRPVTLSAGNSGGFLRGFDQLEKSATGPKKTAKQMIFESATVDSDLRLKLESGEAAATSASKTRPISKSELGQFIKPSGVDEPSTSREPKSKRKRLESASTPERPKKMKGNLS